jgi:hypothetical protein
MSLSVHGTIFIDWLPPEASFPAYISVKNTQSAFPGTAQRGRHGSPRPKVQIACFTIPHFLGQPSLKNVYRVANSDTFLNFPITLISVPVTFFYSVI